MKRGDGGWKMCNNKYIPAETVDHGKALDIYYMRRGVDAISILYKPLSPDGGNTFTPPADRSYRSLPLNYLDLSGQTYS